MVKHFTFVALCIGLAACAVGGPSETPLPEDHASTPETVSVSELVAESDSGTIELDLRSSIDRYQFESGVDFAAVNVVCPGGRSMNMKSWLPELAVEFHVDPSELEAGFVMYLSLQGGTVNSAPICEEGCHAHFEGTKWVCLCY
jgi:hypothetical protein